MEGKYRQKINTILCLVILLFSGCRHEKEVKSVDPLLLSDIRHGDLICRLGDGYFSNRFKEYSSWEKIYSHVGVIESVGDSLFVIHAEASELTGIGHVKRESIFLFLENISIWGVYRLDANDSVCNNIATKAREYADKKTPFDMDFDAADDTKVYCTELVALAINGAVGDSIVKPQLNIGTRRVYGVDNVYLLPEIKMIKKVTD